MRRVEIKGQEVSKTCKVSKAIGTAKAMETVSDTMGIKAGWKAQRVAHVVSRNDSKQDR